MYSKVVPIFLVAAGHCRKQVLIDIVDVSHSHRVTRVRHLPTGRDADVIRDKSKVLLTYTELRLGTCKYEPSYNYTQALLPFLLVLVPSQAEVKYY